MAKRVFLTRTEEDDDDHIMEAIASREQELAMYDTNIDSYTEQLAMITDVPEDLTGGLERYKGKANEQIILAGANTEDALTASQFNHRERIKMLLFTENAEMKKSELAYMALLNKLPEGERRNAAFNRYQVKLEESKLSNK